MTAATPPPPLSPAPGSTAGVRARERFAAALRRAGGGRGLAVSALAVVVVLAIGLAAVAMGSVAGMIATLVVIGFSPDRSVLIASLAVEAVGVAVATFLAPRRRAEILAGVLAFAWLYRDTFNAETTASLKASGADGVFSPGGWWLTLMSLVVTAVLVAWAVATLVALARAQVVLAIADLRSIRSRGLHGATIGRPASVLAVAILLIGTMPVLGDMLNYEPDVDMRQGAGAGIGLADTGPGFSLPPNLPNISPGILTGGGVIAPGETSGTAPASVLATAKPWLAWRPTGAGKIVPLDVPAPYGPSGTMTGLAVYLPPGYATSARRYPVLYEVPWSVIPWSKSLGIGPTLDSLIGSGTIPPVIMVFDPEGGGPFADSECANSKDGREWYATWIAQTVVPAIDAAYRTIPQPDARGLIGFSQGGFCAPMLLLRTPTVFGTAISYSGYFEAGVHSSQTVNAWIPWGGDPAYEAAYSPVDLAATVPQAERPLLFVELSSNPGAPFYGPQYAAFSRVLDGAGIPVALFPNPLGHAWAAVRAQLPVMLHTWAERMTALGVFRP
jgi:enterochelin esterase-like enzyme